MTVRADLFFLMGSGLYLAFGLTHVVLVLWDVRKATLFVPRDGRLKRAMKDTTLTLSRRLSLLETYRGLNLSHGLGVLVFGLMSWLLAWQSYPDLPTMLFVGVAIAFSSANFLVARRYWPGFPTFGYAVTAALFWLAGALSWL